MLSGRYGSICTPAIGSVILLVMTRNIILYDCCILFATGILGYILISTFFLQQILLRRLVLERLLNKLQYISNSASGIDLDYLHFICTHELIFIDALEE